MHTGRLPILLAVTLAGAAPPVVGGPPEPEPSRVEGQVLEANARMNAAAESLDVEEFFGWILDEPGVTIIQDGRLFRDRDEAKAVVREGYQGVASLARAFDRTRVTPLSDDAAVLAASGTTVVELTDGRTLEAPFAVSLVFVRRDGGWKVLHGHYSIPARR